MGKKKGHKPGRKPASVDPVQKERIDYGWKVLQGTSRFVRGLQPDAVPFTKGVDVDDVRGKRRVMTSVKLVEKAQALVESQCALEDYDFGREWLKQNLSAIYSIDFAERKNYCLMGAALWMLDQLREAGTFSSACRAMPMDERIFTELDMVSIWDVSHGVEAVTRMLWTIQHRNDDCVGGISKKKSPYPRYFLDDYTATGQHKQDVPSRQAFEQVLSCVPKERLEEALRLYEETYWDVARRICLTIDVYAREKYSLAVRRGELSEDLESWAEGVRNAEPEVLKKPAFSDLKSWTEGGAFSEQNARARRRFQELERVEAEIDEAQKIVDERFILLRYELGGILSFPKEDRIARYGQEAADIWEDFCIPDPYVLCFGMLYAVEQDSDLPWAYGVSTLLADLCGSVLPWQMAKIGEEEDIFWNRQDSEANYAVAAVNMQVPKRLRNWEFEDWYALDYTNPGEEMCVNNLAQIVFGLTGAVMPRNLERYKGALMELESFGITGKKATQPLLYCMLLLGEYCHRTHVAHTTEELLSLEPKEEPEELVDPVEELQKRVRKLEQENNQLRETAYAAGREARESKLRWESLEETVRAERQELADLRELVFHQQENLFETESGESAIEFPYQVRSRVVVFGGHDSWAREIKPKLPNVRFVGRDMLPNATMIRNADVVWIQTNSLSHAHFYRIIEEVRKYHIPVRYFVYGSATKCAEQVARVDQES